MSLRTRDETVTQSDGAVHDTPAIVPVVTCLGFDHFNWEPPASYVLDRRRN